MQKRKILIAFITPFLCFMGCSKTTLANFWNNFETTSLQKNISDQGIRGGHLSMYWKSNKVHFFSKKQIIEFAIKNDWLLTSQVQLTNDDLKKWDYDGVAIFSLSLEGFDPFFSIKSLEFKKFPRWINTNVTVLSFKTGWVILNPNTNDANEVNGFVIISEDGREMSVYHLWGEKFLKN